MAEMQAKVETPSPSTTVAASTNVGPLDVTGQEEHKTYTYNNNCFYDGNWLGNRRHGQGTFVWPSGAKFEGTFKADLRDGRGKITYSD